LGRRLVYRFNEVFVIQNIEEGSLFVLFAWVVLSCSRSPEPQGLVAHNK
jgi:hypothetical protein